MDTNSDHADTYDAWRCTKCKNYLTNCHVYSIIDTNELVCGKCYTTDMRGLRNLAYEALAKNAIFPMSGSPVDNNVFHCPLKSDDDEECDFIGNKAQFLKHGEESHGFNLINKDHVFAFQAPLCGITVEYLMEALDEAFVVKINFQSESSVHVHVHKLPGNKGNYEFIFISKNVNYDPRSVIPYSSQETFVFNLGPEKNFKLVLQKQEAKPRAGLEGLNKVILNCFECPICLEHMATPIYQCENGHAICSACHKRTNKCPSCNALRFSRCLLAEQISEKLYYCCKYKNCNAFDEFAAIKAHEMVCPHKPYKCPIESCNTLHNIDDLRPHLVNTHHEDLLEINTFNVYPNFMEKPEVRVILKENNIFLFKFKYEKNMLMVLTERYVPADNHCNYKMAFTVGNGKRNEITMNLEIGNYSENKDFNKNCISLPYPLLRPFLIDDVRISCSVDIVSMSIEE